MGEDSKTDLSKEYIQENPAALQRIRRQENCRPPGNQKPPKNNYRDRGNGTEILHYLTPVASSEEAASDPRARWESPPCCRLRGSAQIRRDGGHEKPARPPLSTVALPLRLRCPQEEEEEKKKNTEDAGYGKVWCAALRAAMALKFGL